MAAREPVREPTTVYVALGDSISIDKYAGGPGRGGASLLARNLDDDFPEWRGRDLTSSGDTRFHLLASDGASCRTVLDQQLPRLASLGVAPTIVTLTAGGNDLLAAYGHTDFAQAVVTHVTMSIRRTLEALRLLMPSEGQVVVGTVYDPSDGTADSRRLGLPPWPEGVEVLARLNSGLCATAAQHGAFVADIHERFLGHGVLAGDPTQPSPRPRERDLWYCNLIEPNAWGASQVRAAFWKALHQIP
ncbi:MAG: SGNH/GDSL hydrolase family protein [Nitriliruptorales bacterium]